MKSCIDCESLIPEYLDDELDPALRKEFEEHVGGCDSCRRALEEARMLFGDVRESAQTVPSELKKRVMDEVNIAIRDKKIRRAKFIRIAGSAAACLVVLVGVAVSFFRMNDGLFILDGKGSAEALEDRNTVSNNAPADMSGASDQDHSESELDEYLTSGIVENEGVADDQTHDDIGDVIIESPMPDGAVPGTYGESIMPSDPGESLGSLSDKSESEMKGEETYVDYSESFEPEDADVDLGAYFMTRGAARLAELIDEAE